MTKGTYWIRYNDEKHGAWAKQVEAHVHDTQGFGKILIVKDKKLWSVYEYRTGLFLRQAETRTKAVFITISAMGQHTPEQYRQIVMDGFLKHGNLND